MQVQQSLFAAHDISCHVAIIESHGMVRELLIARVLAGWVWLELRWSSVGRDSPLRRTSRLTKQRWKWHGLGSGLIISLLGRWARPHRDGLCDSAPPHIFVGTCIAARVNPVGQGHSLVDHCHWHGNNVHERPHNCECILDNSERGKTVQKADGNVWIKRP